ncbi:MAG: sugar ABC transporter permease [Bifidobacterium sp.]|uniref:carbohydrate ABC transporter permease n=1 Tax=Bifidobacterium sp. TaxID=41200 RepID=UPI0039ECED5B
MIAISTAKTSRRKKNNAFLENLPSAWFLLPIFIVFAILTVIPLCQTLFYSMTDYNGYSSNFHFIGFKNYSTIFADPSLLQALSFTLLYAIVTTLLITLLAIPLAVTLNSAMWGRSFARSLFFFLGVPSQAIIGLVWKFIFSPLDAGVINKILASVGLHSVQWLSQDGTAKFCVIIVAVWMQVGWHATLYLAYLQTIPHDLYEQAKVDGANAWDRFEHITLPQLVPGISVSMFLLMTGGLKIYDLPYTLTGGGPGTSTNTITQAIILRGIDQSNYALGSALASLFTIACIVVIALQMKATDALGKRFA